MRRFLLIAVLAIAVGTGCGGSDNGGSSDSTATNPSSSTDSSSTNPSTSTAPFPTSATAPASKKEYIAQADAACAEFRQRVQALPQPKTAKDVGKLYDQIGEEAQKFYDSFQAIPKPKEGQALLARYQKNLTESIKITEQAAAAIKKNDTKNIGKLFATTKRLQAQDRKIAKKFGFKVCGGNTTSTKR
jgi:hypothetical protein